MSKPTNKHPYRLGNEHGEIKFGHIIKEKQFGYYVRTGDDGGRHYIRMRSNGDVSKGLKGSTDIHAPGSVNINCGQDIRGTKSKDGGDLAVPKAFIVKAENGDIIISAPHGSIKLSAKNIDLIATDPDSRNGNIKLDASKLVSVEAPDINIDSTVSTKLASTNQVNLVGKAAMNVYGGLMDFADGATALLGSKTSDKISAKAGKLSSVLEDSMRDLPASLEAAANELKKSGITQKLEQLATSSEISELTGELEGVAGELAGTLSKSEQKLKEMSNKYGDFFKKNLT